MTLRDVLARGYTAQGMRVYRGTPAPYSAALSAETSPLAAPLRAQGETITGAIALYRNTETAMTLEFAAASGGTVVDMQVWTDKNSTQVWQPYDAYAEVPIASEYFVRFRDAAGNVSPIVSVGTPVIPDAVGAYQSRAYLPLIQR